MTYRITVVCALLSCIVFTTPPTVQAGTRRLDMKARVLNLLFPLDVTPGSYFLKMVLRFDDPDTQLVIVTYSGGRSEMIRYSLAGLGNVDLSQFISKMVAENPDVKEQAIAEKLKVDIRRSPIKQEALNRLLNELRAIRISPILASRIAVDDYSEYEFWCDTGQESVHYAITGPFGTAHQDKLGQWMMRVRANLPVLLGVEPVLKP